MALKLYHHPGSTCSQKVRLALAEKALAYDEHVIDWSIAEHLQPWYLALNANGVVPTLVHDGAPVTDSSAICEYLDDVFPTPALTPAEPLARARMRAWMRYFEEVPTAAIRIPSYNLVYAGMQSRRSDELRRDMAARRPVRAWPTGDNHFSEAETASSMQRLRKCAVRVDAALADGARWLLGDQFTIADIVLLPSIVRVHDLRLTAVTENLPHLADWYARACARPSFDVAYMPRSRITLAG